MQAYSFNKEKYIDSGRYEGSFAIKREKYLNSSDYKIAFYDENQKMLYGSLNEKIDFSKKIQFSNKDLILIDDSTVGHLGIGYIVIKDQSFEERISKLKRNIIGFFFVLYFIIAVIGFYLAKLFLKPIRNERIKLNNFIKDTTHELNTPISAILMSTEQDTLNEKQIQRIRLSAKRLSEVYKDLTYIFLKNSNEKISEDLKLNEILEEQLEYFKVLAIKKKITLNIELEEFTYKMNRDDFIRIINNLISNAVKYNKTNGTLDVILKDGVLSIKDSGIGIDEKKIKDVFKRYYRATPQEGGFGIGLNIVSHICKKYNIKIDVHSQNKKGTTFTLKF